LLPILFGEGGPPPPPPLPTADLPFEDCAEASAWSFFQVNEARRTQGLPPLRFDPHLAALAQDQSRRMREAGRIAHEIPAGRTLARRLAHAGIDVTVAAENVAVNTTPQGALRAFLRSPSHRRNLFDPRFDEIGIGIVIDRAAAYRRRFFVTQIVARRHATVGE
ncbi:MAG: CAP domain-containing protein, partial [Deltaproteobacteria bacterium]